MESAFYFNNASTLPFRSAPRSDGSDNSYPSSSNESPPPSFSDSLAPTASLKSPAPTFVTVSPTIDAEQAHDTGAAVTLLLVMVLTLSILTGYGVRNFGVKYIPESAATMLIGIIAGGIAKAVYPDGRLPIDFNAQIFFFVLLPPIIFEAGYTLKKKRFFANIGTISLYAVVGTLVSTFVVGFLTYGAAVAGLIRIEHKNPLQALMFGALISAVDPVATLAIMGDPSMNINPLLYSLVFGESVLNDAVAIVLFHVFGEYITELDNGPNSKPSEPHFTFGDISTVLLRFFGITIGSLLVGIGLGLLCSFVFVRTNMKEYHTKEIQLLFLTAFGSFALSEVADLSGVMALFFCGVTLSHYNFHNLSNQSKISSVYVFESMAATAENVVFVYIGLTLSYTSTTWDPAFIILGVIFCMVGRAVNIFSLSWLANLGRQLKIPLKMQIVIFYAGLRGAVAYALSMQMTGSGSTESVQVVQSTTLLLVVITTVLLGSTTEPVISRMGMSLSGSRTARAESDELREDFYSRMQHGGDSNDGGGGGGGGNVQTGTQGTTLSTRYTGSKIHSMWKRLDNIYLKPIFGGSRPNSTAHLGSIEDADNDNDDEDEALDVFERDIGQNTWREDKQFQHLVENGDFETEGPKSIDRRNNNNNDNNNNSNSNNTINHTIESTGNMNHSRTSGEGTNETVDHSSSIQRYGIGGKRPTPFRSQRASGSNQSINGHQDVGYSDDVLSSLAAPLSGSSRSSAGRSSRKKFRRKRDTSGGAQTAELQLNELEIADHQPSGYSPPTPSPTRSDSASYSNDT